MRREPYGGLLFVKAIPGGSVAPQKHLVIGFISVIFVIIEIILWPPPNLLHLMLLLCHVTYMNITYMAILE